MKVIDERGNILYEMGPRYNIEILKSGQEKRRERRRDEREKKKFNHLNTKV